MQMAALLLVLVLAPPRAQDIAIAIHIWQLRMGDPGITAIQGVTRVADPAMVVPGVGGLPPLPLPHPLHQSLHQRRLHLLQHQPLLPPQPQRCSLNTVLYFSTGKLFQLRCCGDCAGGPQL